jgi:hypothetical protein
MACFKIGQSGNPAGRPKGAIGVITKRRAALLRHLPEIVIATQDLSRYGDTENLTQCLKMAIEAKI